MNLEKAIETLKIEKSIAELELSKNPSNKHIQDFINAVDVIFDFVNFYTNAKIFYKE